MRKHFVAVVHKYHASDDKTVDKLKHRNKALREVIKMLVFVSMRLNVDRNFRFL